VVGSGLGKLLHYPPLFSLFHGWDTGIADHTRWPISLLGSHVPLAKENMMGLSSESVNAPPVLVDCPDLCYKQA